ncbi:MAG TPA: nucleoside monophosphate kinase, partial [Candidatus Thermoplasmatota archaeon]|nr:nucleoside monophosphate kinase [Candidatus Thermoplasmatota archaeon]
SIDLDNVQNVIVTGKSGAGKQPRIDVLAEEFDLEQLSTGDIFRHYLGIFDKYDYDGDLSQFWDEEQNRFVADETIANEIGTEDNDVLLGLKAKYFVERGLFGPDYIVNALFESKFAEKDYKNQILDGYPRTLDQAKFLLNLVSEKDVSLDFMVLVDNSDERIIQRTVQRRICPKCGKVYHLTYKPPKNGKCENCGVDVIQRSDDTEEKIKSRLQEFKKKALPAIEYLQDQGIPLVNVPGHLEEFTPENVRKSVMNEVEKLVKQ